MHSCCGNLLTCFAPVCLSVCLNRLNHSLALQAALAKLQQAGGRIRTSRAYKKQQQKLAAKQKKQKKANSGKKKRRR